LGMFLPLNRLKYSMSFTDKVVLITGASGGIGAALARTFDNKGARVCIASRRKEKLDELAVQLHDPLVLPVDLSDEVQVIGMIDEVIKKFGRIDILINNAASIIVSPAETVTTGDMIKTFRTNLIAPMKAIQHALPFMRMQGGGHIINVGSPGYMMGIPFYTPYVCSKAALSAFTRTIQAEWAGTNIFVSEYFPGYVKTKSSPESRVGEIDQDLLMSPKQNFLTKTFARPKNPEEVARQLVKLAEHPRILAYSSFSIKLGAYISNISSFRLSIAKEMARIARLKLGIRVFEDM
jgi:NAD(P)-dependent dehydrogenase (short-subunit alcohol dehydrogenase family)